MADHSLLSPWIRRFLLEHLIAERIAQLERVQAQRDVRLLGGDEQQTTDDQS